MNLFAFFGLDEDFGGSSVGRHLQNTLGLGVKDGPVDAPARAKGLAGIAQRYGRATRNRDLFQLAVAIREEPDPLPVGGEKGATRILIRPRNRSGRPQLPASGS